MKALSKVSLTAVALMVTLGLQPISAPAQPVAKAQPSIGALWQLGHAEAAGNRSEFCQEMHQNMVNRKENFTIFYSGDTAEIANNIEGVLDQVFSMKGNNGSDDFDYLRWNWKNWNCSINGAEGGANFTFNIDYREPAGRLAAVNQKVARDLPGLIGANDFETIKNVHDYVINQIDYDRTLCRYTAYEGVIENSTVCQGYALLTYKMLTDAGIPVRFMGGYAGEAHAWNIVKLGDKWYFLDNTWDDPITGGKPVLRYDYFLIGSDKMYKDHKPDPEWNTPEVKAAYNISTTDYNPEYAETEDKKSMDEETYDRVIAREEFRQLIVDSFDEAKSYESKSKLNQRALDLNKKVMIAAVSGMTDAAFNKMSESETGVDEMIDLASKRFEEAIFNPLEAYVESPEYESLGNQELEKFYASHKLEGLSEAEVAALEDKMTTQLADNLLSDKLHQLSGEHTNKLIASLIKELNAKYQ